MRGLLEVGANPNVATNVRFFTTFDFGGVLNTLFSQDRNFALHEAVSHGSVEAVKLLLEGGAKRTTLDKVFVTLSSLRVLNMFGRMP